MGAQIISFNCQLKNKAGKLISTTFNRDVLTASQQPGGMLSGLSKGLENIKKGEKRSIFLPAQEAYGLYDPRKIISLERSSLPENLRVGHSVQLSPNGSPMLYKVIQIQDDVVTLDGNHPLAGQDLIFEIETLDVRDATRDEINDSLGGFSSQLLH